MYWLLAWLSSMAARRGCAPRQWRSPPPTACPLRAYDARLGRARAGHRCAADADANRNPKAKPAAEARALPKVCEKTRSNAHIGDDVVQLCVSVLDTMVQAAAILTPRSYR